MSRMPGAMNSGFHGKVPWVGDFVQRRLPADLVDAWEVWLDGLLPTLPAWAITPGPRQRPWSLLCAPGVCGASAWAGVVGVSMDRVGRRFPLLIARPVHADARAGGLLDAGLTWFAAAGAVHAMTCSGAISGNDALEARVLALPAGDDDITVPAAGTANASAPHAAAWQRCLADGGSLWWRGEEEPSCLLRGLPDSAHCRGVLAIESSTLETDA